MSSQLIMFSNGGAYGAVTNPAASFAGQTALVTSAPFVQFECPQAGTIHSLFVRVDANTSDVNQTVTIRKNGSGDANQVATITAGGTGVFVPAANTPFTVAVGDLIDIAITSGAGNNNVLYSIFSLIYTITAPNKTIQVVANKTGGALQMTSGTSNYTPLIGSLFSSGTSVQTNAGFVERETVEYTYLRTYSQTNAGTSAAWVAISTDGADTALIATITAATTGEFLNTATTVSISSGSVVSFRGSNTSNTGAGTTVHMSMVQVQRNTAWAYVGANNGSSGVFTSATRTVFWPIAGFGTTGQTTEAITQVTARARFRTRNMQVNIPANAGGTTVCFRVNSSNAITLPLSSGQVGTFLDSTQGPSLVSTDLINFSIQCTTAGVTGGFTIAGMVIEMASIDTIPFRTLMGVGI